MFQVFALRAGPPVEGTLGRRACIDLVLERAIGVGCLIGTYERSERVKIDAIETAPTTTLGLGPESSLA